MEGIQTKHKILNDEIYNLDVINILKDINVSAFIDKWGPTDVLQVYDPEIKMQGFLVIDNLALGTGCGELRISSNIIPHRIFQQARSMTWICALSNINFGGAAAAIRANTDNINKIEFVKSFAREVSPFVPNQYVAAPSIDIGKCEMAAFVEEIGIRKGATGKPKGMGGIPRELGVIGFGMGVAIETTIEASQYLSTFPTDISDAKIALQGFDVIGATIAKYLARKGAKIVAISDQSCTVFNPNGINISDVIKHSSMADEKCSLKKYKPAKKLPRNDIIKVACDFLVTTTGNNVLTDENIHSLKAKCVVEGVNEPINHSAEQILDQKGILVLPDILTTAGGAISSYAEYTGTCVENAFSLIESRIKETTIDVIQRSLDSGIYLKRIAKELAKERILQAMEVE